MLGALLSLAVSAAAQTTGGLSDWLAPLPEPHDYVLSHISSYDRSGGNEDWRKIPAGGPGNVAKQ
jgi:hypothetical protein